MVNDLPLKGKTVLVTRNKKQAAPFRKKVEALGGTAVSASLITFQEALPGECADRLREDLSEPGWLVFTSVNGVRFFFSYLAENGVSAPDLKKIAAVGEKTARALKKRGVTADVMPDEYVAECLADTLKQHAAVTEPITVIKGNLSRDVIKTELEPLGYQIREWVLYNTIQDEKGMAELRQAASRSHFDYITFTSSSAVHTFMHAVDKEKVWENHGTAYISIGPLTEKALLEYGISSHVPKIYTIEGMLDVMCSMSRKER
ncbi:uroporphyrinogen-III synthase [Bacillus sp. ISL-51]|uniref:uroporphyrinogen-III synthase n=1 Tax=unclassified Bacillus (in: firmicutes) TaxID=185979 RepID=UPI001BE5FBF2|nr:MULTISPECIES: uroporphyrinogen-III synthase [unclassified Bacillus (in: firmicutes)]MBT2574222.1 uroporphyrinogen-III synthase [Bacillus sp. ISL-51]MBT2633041.1 uroporphyrinogen-III synthase [Bacillus sp. ISL-26]